MTAEISPIALVPEQRITGLTADSRQVQPGYLFAALAGQKADGTAFIDDALARGAAAVLTEPGPDLSHLRGPHGSVAVLTAANPRLALARMAARFYGNQPAHIAAVTGTNGKTSVAVFTRQLWAALGHRAGSLGTLGLDAPGFAPRPGLTTPDPVTLHAVLAELALGGVDHLAMEASSHGLHQYRLDGVRVSAAGFTNLSRDHLDYHGTMEAYLEAKARLFADVLSDGGVAVLNKDDKTFATLDALCDEAGHPVISYGGPGADVALLEHRVDGLRQVVTLDVLGHRETVALDLVGAWQVQNALCALGLVITETPGRADRAVAALHGLRGAPGRMELAGRRDDGAVVYVDYAHTPDALENALASLRPHVAGRLLVVFGCGGDRDAGKRAPMGAIAAKCADVAYLTDDNPRTEDPAAIRAQVREGCPHAVEIGDRTEAIHAAVEALKPSDVLLIAGKGHETVQIVGEDRLPFDDRAEARRALALGTEEA